MPADQKQKIALLIAFVVISVAVTGYFVGLQSPMNPMAPVASASTSVAFKDHAIPTEGEILLSTSYEDMAAATRLRASKWQTRITDWKSQPDPMSEVIVTPEEKLAALGRREGNRAFNGAPPTIPHPVDHKSANACIACHGTGLRSESLRIPRMSHPFLANCTQCHVESDPQNMPAELFRANEFVGLTTPTGGPRAYAGAPPQIPHSTWMRNDCMSCHGFTGQQGIRTTHPWRQNCQQCHASSAIMDQTLLGDELRFLSPPDIERNAPNRLREESK